MFNSGHVFSHEMTT